MPIPCEEWTLPCKRVGARVQVYERLDSTNTLALSLALDPRHDGLVILAREQTAGRGQYGRSWLAPPTSSVLLSALVFPPPELRRPVVLTAWAAVSVCELVEQITGSLPGINWPNDIQTGGRKLAGILIEQRTLGTGALATVVGVGLNVTQPAAWFAEAGLPEATSLACLTRCSLETSEVARRLIALLDALYDRLLGGDLTILERAWKRRLELLGKAAEVELHNGDAIRGRIRDLTFGGLAVEDASGETMSLAPERIKHIR